MEISELDGRNRNDVALDLYVGVVLKKDQVSGEITDGIITKILTNSKFHPHGIKVQLDTGEVGRVKVIYDED
ncbi:YwbE family protein [Crocinitomix catalasitica]|uniref:YwbE family protein n=1 Tax=Crocinitomix catalasitica TaxID=184607 RepID=UPI000480B4A9|nr:YwbE family protein [Crocinitomix catalasitica]